MQAAIDFATPELAASWATKLPKLRDEKHSVEKYAKQRLNKQFTTRRDNDNVTVPHLRGEFTTSHSNPPSWIGPKWGKYRWGRIVTLESDNGGGHWSWRRPRRTNYIKEQWQYIADSEWAEVRASNTATICAKCRDCDTDDRE